MTLPLLLQWQKILECYHANHKGNSKVLQKLYDGKTALMGRQISTRVASAARDEPRIRMILPFMCALASMVVRKRGRKREAFG